MIALKMRTRDMVYKIKYRSTTIVINVEWNAIKIITISTFKKKLIYIS